MVSSSRATPLMDGIVNYKSPSSDTSSDALTPPPDTPTTAAKAARMAAAANTRDRRRSSDSSTNEPLAMRMSPTPTGPVGTGRKQVSSTGVTTNGGSGKEDPFTYPAAVPDISVLSNRIQSFKLARWLKCRTEGCDCSGLRPPPNVKVVLEDEVGEGNEDEEEDDEMDDGEDVKGKKSRVEKLWEICGSCGHGWASASEEHGGHLLPEEVDTAERDRRRRVIGRVEELLQDKGKLLDFNYTDPAVESLLQQLEPFDPLQKKLRERSASLDTPTPTGSPKSRKRPRDSAASSESSGSSSEDDIPLNQKALPKGKTASKGTGGGGRTLAGTTAGKKSRKGESKKGKGAGKKTAKGQRGPVNTAPKQDGVGDMIVDENGKEIRELNEDWREKLANGEDIDMDETQEELPPTAEEVQEEAALIDRLTSGVTVDVDTDRMADIDAMQLDTEDDWAQVQFETLPPKPAVEELRQGYIRTQVVSSSEPSPSTSIILIGLKNLFQRQLPKMPREYITRLVLDQKHYSMAIVKRGYRVVGGVCYRPFDARGFAEIVFFAIDSTEQIRGYGSFLMNCVKDYVRERHPTINHFLTYADNYAIGYFKKQGFTKEITFPRDKWVGYIKDYDSANLMMCKMIRGLKYREAAQMLHNQKSAVLAKIRTISQSHVVQPGLQVFKDRKPGEKIKLSKEQIPGLLESGWDEEMDQILRQPIRNQYHVLITMILNDMQNDSASWPFTKPVDPSQVADYYTTIKDPMDLSKMEAKLENNHYKDLEEFTRDAKLMFSNCRLYNGYSTSNQYTKAADMLERCMVRSIEKRTKAMQKPE